MQTIENECVQTINHGSVRFLLSEAGGAFYCVAYRGKAKRPFANYRFRSVERRAEWLLSEQESEDRRQAGILKRKLEDAEALQAMRDKLQVGTILHYSWGYEQTQCEFFQVIARKGASVVIRRIAGETVVGSEGFMSDRRKPVPGEFLDGEPELLKRINRWGLSMDHGVATPCESDRAFYRSWYG